MSLLATDQPATWHFGFAKRDRKVFMRINREIKRFKHKVWGQTEARGIQIHSNLMIVLLQQAGTREGKAEYVRRNSR